MEVYVVIFELTRFSATRDTWWHNRILPFPSFILLQLSYCITSITLRLISQKSLGLPVRSLTQGEVHFIHLGLAPAPTRRCPQCYAALAEELSARARQTERKRATTREMGESSSSADTATGPHSLLVTNCGRHRQCFSLMAKKRKKKA